MIRTSETALLRDRLEPLRAALLNHAIYGRIDSLEKLHRFMEHHVFAVWDFMSLLKGLQQHVCCVTVPWLPPADSHAARFLHEIVLAEETDHDPRGGYASHFELYHRAMRQCGASTEVIDNFLERLRAGASPDQALVACQAPAAVRPFVRHTFEVLGRGEPCAIAAAFAFGREDLLPGLFRRIVEELNVEAAGGLDLFHDYLQRHIELDGEHHGPLAERLIATLCGGDSDKWRLAEQAAWESLQARLALWDALLDKSLAT